MLEKKCLKKGMNNSVNLRKEQRNFEVGLSVEKWCESSFWPPWFLMRNPLSFESFHVYI